MGNVECRIENLLKLFSHLHSYCHLLLCHSLQRSVILVGIMQQAFSFFYPYNSAWFEPRRHKEHQVAQRLRDPLCPSCLRGSRNHNSLYILPGKLWITPCNSKFKIAAATALLLRPLLILISSI